LGERKVWPALLIRSATSETELTPPSSELVSATLDDFSPVAIEDLAELPLPPGGLWDPTFAALPDHSLAAPLQWRAFFGSAADRDAAAMAMKTAYPSMRVEVEDVQDDDWAARSQRELTSIRAGTFVVAPPWDIPVQNADTTTIVIVPSRGFGTGHHASTRLCLRTLSDAAVRGRSVLDVGTGSGVLAMAAAKRGARVVTAVDIDPDAIDAARSSAALNEGVETVDWQVGDFRDKEWSVLTAGWDLVLANLTGGMLISSAQRLRELVGANGSLIVSGFDIVERARVEDALQMRTRAALTEDGWVGLVLTH
jgi:ribosomal protein L11 methyltransferase